MRSSPEDGASADADDMPSRPRQACLFVGATCRRRRKMATRPAPMACVDHVSRLLKDCLSRLRSGASTSCRRAALTLVRTAPCFLGNRPARIPIGKPSIAIVWLRRGHAPTALVWTALAVNPAAPFLFGHGPACLPVREPIFAIVGICRAWWFCRLATDVMIAAAPCLLALVPHLVHPHCAIVRISRSEWHCGRCGGHKWGPSRGRCGGPGRGGGGGGGGRGGGQRGWPSRRPRGWRCGRRRG